MSVYLKPQIKNQFCNKIQKPFRAFAAAVMFCIPTNVGDSFSKTIETNITPKVENVLNSAMTKSFQIVEDINCRGGVTHYFDDISLKKLQKILNNTRNKNTYVFPIDSALHPYIPSTGQFGSLRPGGRAHLGVDIYPRLYGRKPPKPVAVLSATDGIVISVKKSPVKDPKNLIANNIKIMGTDGKIYSYDHLGRPEDYKNAKYTPLKRLGEIVHAGDTLGTVGKTGETEVWHLHFGINDLSAKEKQQKNPVWKKMYKAHSVYATPMGQVDPLDSTKAGGISNTLNQYKIDKGPKVDYVEKL